MTRNIVFVCLHGAAKSVIAAAHCQRLAGQRGLDVRATSAGTAPDPAVPPGVVQGLLGDGLDVRRHSPRRVTREELAGAWRVVTFGCDLGDLAPPGLALERWDDVPAVSEGFARARDLIVARLPRVLDDCAGSEG